MLIVIAIATAFWHAIISWGISSFHMLGFFISNFLYYQYCMIIPTFYTNHPRIILSLYSNLIVTSIEFWLCADAPTI